MPYLEEHFNPRLIATLAREAFLARETWAFIESAANRLLRISIAGAARAF